MEATTAAIIQGGGAVAGGIAGMFGRKKQHERNKELMGLQSQYNAEAQQRSKDLQMQMWNETSYPAQVAKMKEAGLSPGLMYGMGGGAGATTGSGSEGGVGLPQAPGGNFMGDALTGVTQVAQIEAIKAQTKKTEAETDNIKEETKGSEWENAVRLLIEPKIEAEARHSEAQARSAKSDKEMLEYESWKANAQRNDKGQNVAVDDPSSPLSRSIRAEFKMSEQELIKAKNENDIKEAEKIVKNFEAELAKNGIHYNSPWYVKLITDLASKVGITNLIK